MCDLSHVIDFHPRRRLSGTTYGIIVSYVTIFLAILAWQMLHAVYDISGAFDVHELVVDSLGLSDKEVAAMPWSLLLRRVVGIQVSTYLSTYLPSIDHHTTLSVRVRVRVDRGLYDYDHHHHHHHHHHHPLLIFFVGLRPCAAAHAVMCSEGFDGVRYGAADHAEG